MSESPGYQFQTESLLRQKRSMRVPEDMRMQMLVAFQALKFDVKRRALHVCSGFAEK